MEITPVTPAVRTAKVRSAKTAVPKSSSTPAQSATVKPAAATLKRKILTKRPALPTATAELTHMIATAAYYLAEQRQFTPGHELQDWLVAEQLIRGGTNSK